MSQDVRATLGDAVKKNAGLNDQLKKATDLNQVIAVFKAAGINISKTEFLRSEAEKILKLSDAELENANISVRYTTDTWGGCVTYVLTCCP